jgi:hypothetical protein
MLNRMDKDAGVQFKVKTFGIAMALYRPNVRFLAIQLASIQKQVFANWKCLITADSSLEPLRKDPALSTFFDDERFFWIENEKQLGVKRNFEKSIGLLCKENIEAIACCDQDDIWHINKLEKLAGQLNELGPHGLVHSDMRILVGEDHFQKATLWQKESRLCDNIDIVDIIIKNVVTGASMAMGKELAKNYSKIPDCFDYHDHWFATVALAKGQLRSFNRPLADYRQHASNVVGATKKNAIREISKSFMALGIQKKLEIKWEKALARATHVHDHVVADKQIEKLFFSHDRGLELFVRGLQMVFRNMPQALQCLALALAKLCNRKNPNT